MESSPAQFEEANSPVRAIQLASTAWCTLVARASTTTKWKNPPQNPGVVVAVAEDPAVAVEVAIHGAAEHGPALKPSPELLG